EQAASLEHRLQRLRERRSAIQNPHGTAVDDVLDGQSPHQHEFGAEFLQEVCSLRQITFVLVTVLQLLLLDDPTEGDLILAVEIEADDRVHSAEVAAFDHIEVCTVAAFQDVGDAFALTERASAVQDVITIPADQVIALRAAEQHVPRLVGPFDSELRVPLVQGIDQDPPLALVVLPVGDRDARQIDDHIGREILDVVHARIPGVVLVVLVVLVADGPAVIDLDVNRRIGERRPLAEHDEAIDAAVAFTLDRQMRGVLLDFLVVAVVLDHDRTVRARQRDLDLDVRLVIEVLEHDRVPVAAELRDRQVAVPLSARARHGALRTDGDIDLPRSSLLDRDVRLVPDTDGHLTVDVLSDVHIGLLEEADGDEPAAAVALERDVGRLSADNLQVRVGT